MPLGYRGCDTLSRAMSRKSILHDIDGLGDKLCDDAHQIGAPTMLDITDMA